VHSRLKTRFVHQFFVTIETVLSRKCCILRPAISTFVSTDEEFTAAAHNADVNNNASNRINERKGSKGMHLGSNSRQHGQYISFITTQQYRPALGETSIHGSFQFYTCLDANKLKEISSIDLEENIGLRSILFSSIPMPVVIRVSDKITGTLSVYGYIVTKLHDGRSH